LSYLVLARKSRPQSFAEVVGQQAVVRTLENALRQNRVPHALIFSGVRGTGKTTLARIMAKALNCEQGPTSEPCNVCLSCMEIKAGSSVDLHEVDGASNRGIQEIRELKENIRFMPTNSRFKIIIIDEVHMLTTEAFNALLKTLEEPPEHVYFMFATTELHKVPVTILSRCQRYELKRISHKELYDHFSSLAAGEGVEIDEAALNMVVREAGGSVRDGLSLLDQVFSYCGDTVTGQEVVEVLGLVSHQVIGDLAESLLAGDLASALARLDEVYSYGMDLKRFINELLSWFRGLVVCSVSKHPEQLLDMPADELAVLQKTAAAYSSQSLSFMFHLLMEGLEKAAYASRPRFGVEMVFIKAVQAGDVVPLTELLGRLDDVLAGVALPQQAVEPSAAQRRYVRVVESLPTDGKKEVAGDESASLVEKKKTEPEPAKPEIEHDPVPQVEEIPLPPEPVIAEPTVEKHEEHEEKKVKPAGRKKNVRAHWPEFIEYVRDRSKWMAATLQRASSAQFEEGQLIIVYNDSVDCRILKSKKNMIQLSEFAMDFFQESMQITFKVPDSSACDTDPDSGAAVQKERQALANDPLVLTALEIFNGQVGDIRVGPRFRKPLTGEPNQGSSD
jgi:DNA polymerase-3 subunit gamma/tau